MGATRSQVKHVKEHSEWNPEPWTRKGSEPSCFRRVNGEKETVFNWEIVRLIHTGRVWKRRESRLLCTIRENCYCLCYFNANTSSDHTTRQDIWFIEVDMWRDITSTQNYALQVFAKMMQVAEMKSSDDTWLCLFSPTCVCPTTQQPAPCSEVLPLWRWRHSFPCLTLTDGGSPHTVEPACEIRNIIFQTQISFYCTAQINE